MNLEVCDMTVKHGNKVKEAHDLVKQYIGKNTKVEGEENAARIKRVDEAYLPILIKDNNVAVAPDFHGPFWDRKLESCLYKVGDDYEIDTLIIPGDFFDCDNYTSFLKMTYIESFQEELKHMKVLMERLGNHFRNIYFCRGNHEKRWLQMNKGLVDIENLFSLLKSKVNYKVTLDDHIFLNSGHEMWRLSHPTNFSPCPLSVASRLADKHHMNILSAHGHQFAQGYDKSGDYQIVDGGGMFDVQQIEYLRNTTCYPSVHSGFYLIQDGDAYPFPGKNVNGRYR
jgi:hypothetical protein